MRDKVKSHLKAEPINDGSAVIQIVVPNKPTSKIVAGPQYHYCFMWFKS